MFDILRRYLQRAKIKRCEEGRVIRGTTSTAGVIIDGLCVSEVGRIKIMVDAFWGYCTSAHFTSRQVLAMG